MKWPPLCGLAFCVTLALSQISLPLVQTRFDELTLGVPRGWVVVQQKELLQAWIGPGTAGAPALFFYRFSYNPGYRPRQMVDAMLQSWRVRGTVDEVESLPARQATRFRIQYAAPSGERMRSAAIVQFRPGQQATLVTAVALPEPKFAQIGGDALARSIALSVSRRGDSQPSVANPPGAPPAPRAPSVPPAPGGPESDRVKDQAVLTLYHIRSKTPGFPAQDMPGAWVEGSGSILYTKYPTWVPGTSLVKEANRFGNGRVLRLNPNRSYALSVIREVGSGTCRSHMEAQESGNWNFDGAKLTLKPDAWQNSASICGRKPQPGHGTNPPRTYTISSATLEEMRVGASGGRQNRGLVLYGPCLANLEPGCNTNSLDPLGKPVSEEITLQKQK